MERVFDAIPDDVTYQVCALLLRDKWSMTEITKWLRANGYPTAKREWPRKLLARAFDRELLQLPAREHYELGMRIHRNSGVACRVAEVDDHDEAALEGVAELAADEVLHLIRQVHAAGQETHPTRDEVHIGLAAGETSKAFAAHLARKLKGEKKLPHLWLHTLTSGFFVDNPDNAPVVSLGQFNDIEPRPEYVVLLSAPLLPSEEAAKLPKRPFTREAFEAAANLDIVVTSVSVANHAHSVFLHAITQEDPARSDERIGRMQQRGWAGDIMWQPYAKDGRPIDPEVRPVSVVDFADLKRLANTTEKHVVCIAGPCAECHMNKKEAVVPLIRSTQARRPFSHLVTTESTARAICTDLGW